MGHGVMGDPVLATAEKGGRLFGVLLERLVALCREYHAEDPPRYREFGSHCPQGTS
jgi:creatinine amidohydrolase/Fe(II)-dependent formamide hydrolase-like protein